MNSSRSSPILPLQKAFYAIACCIILIGAIATVWTYTHADDTSTIATKYIIAGDAVYAAREDDSKIYVRDMTRLGGRSMMLMQDLSEAWHGLWQGQTLAFTLLVLSLILALPFYLAAKYLPNFLQASDTQKEKSQIDDC